MSDPAYTIYEVIRRTIDLETSKVGNCIHLEVIRILQDDLSLREPIVAELVEKEPEN